MLTLNERKGCDLYISEEQIGSYKGVNWGIRPKVKLMCVTGRNTTGTSEGLECHEQLWLMHVIYG